MRLRGWLLGIVVICFVSLSMQGAEAQFLGQGPRDNFRDTSMLKPAPGSKVSVIVFEDLGCPACAHAHPIEAAVALKYHCPIVRYDFPIPAHIWTFNAAVCARYLQEKVSAKVADEYRSAVFLAQASIANRDDLQRYTQRWMQQHGQQIPFVMDPKGELAAKVQADYNLGLRLGLTHTPTIVVATQNRYQVVCGVGDSCEPNQLFPVVEAAIEQTKSLPLPAKASGTIRR